MTEEEQIAYALQMSMQDGAPSMQDDPMDEGTTLNNWNTLKTLKDLENLKKLK